MITCCYIVSNYRAYCIQEIHYKSNELRIHMLNHIVKNLDASSCIALFLSSIHLIQVHIDNLTLRKESSVLEFYRAGYEHLGSVNSLYISVILSSLLFGWLIFCPEGKGNQISVG